MEFMYVCKYFFKDNPSIHIQQSLQHHYCRLNIFTIRKTNSLLLHILISYASTQRVTLFTPSLSLYLLKWVIKEFVTILS